MPKTVNLYEAKTHLSELVERAAAGDEVVIAKAGRPRARLTAIVPDKPRRKPGLWKGRVWMSADFDDELPEDLLSAFEGKVGWRILLDTHVFLWWCANDRRLRRELRRHLADPRSVVHVSAASAWEIAIKQGLGRLRIPGAVHEAVIRTGFIPLDIKFEHASVAGSLPPHHRDPFDRMLVAQAQVEGLSLATYDSRLDPYPVTRLS